ncbi:MAG: peroxiredoxin-like family protein [Thermohalobaculum sp.]
MTSEQTINSALRETEKEIVQRRGNAIKALFDQQVDAAARRLSNISKIQLGAMAPDFLLPSTSGNSLSLSEELKKHRVVLTFYRGSWCNFCNTALRIWQRNLSKVHAKKATLWAIAPEKLESALEFQQAAGLKYTLLSDHENKVAEAYNLVFELPQDARETLEKLGTDVGSYNGTGDWSVPITATYVIGQDGRILLADCGPDYRQRMEPEAVLSVL